MAKEAEALLQGDPDIVVYTSYVGQGSVRFWLGLNPVLPNRNFAEIVVVTQDLEARERVKARLEQEIADGAVGWPGPASTASCSGRRSASRSSSASSGPTRSRCARSRDRFATSWRRTRTSIDAHLDWNEQVKSIRLEVDQDRARALGLTPADVSQSLQTLLSGYTVTQYRDGTEQTAVVARAVAGERLDLAQLPSLTVASRNGVAVPLSQVARLAYEFEEPILWRRDRDLVITVRADIVDGVQAPDVTQTPSCPRWPRSWRRCRRATGSRPAALSRRARRPTLRSPRSSRSWLVVMLTLLMIQLQSFSRVGLVLLTAPLGVIGATLRSLSSASRSGSWRCSG